MKRKAKFRVYGEGFIPGIQDKYWYFNLIATNGRVISSSQVYESKQACLKGIASVAKNAPDAVVEEIK